MTERFGARFAVHGGLFQRLSTLTVAEIRALPSMHPQRADVITAGALIAAAVERSGVDQMELRPTELLPESPPE